MQLLVRQSRPKAPMATRNLYLQARPIEVYPVISALLPGCGAASVPLGHLELLVSMYHRSHDSCHKLSTPKQRTAA